MFPFPLSKRRFEMIVHYMVDFTVLKLSINVQKREEEDDENKKRKQQSKRNQRKAN